MKCIYPTVSLIIVAFFLVTGVPSIAGPAIDLSNITAIGSTNQSKVVARRDGITGQTIFIREGQRLARQCGTDGAECADNSDCCGGYSCHHVVDGDWGYCR